VTPCLSAIYTEPEVKRPKACIRVKYNTLG